MTGKRGGRFEVGLTMAGAVSAGAYTAGVLDFLFQALTEWQRAKEAGEDVSHHEVVIRVISGGMVGALSLLSLAQAPPKDVTVVPGSRGTPCAYFLPGLWRNWVERPALVGQSAWHEEQPERRNLLGRSDLGRDEAGADLPVRSLLNCDALDVIADLAFADVGEPGCSLPWIAEDLRLFLTLTSLQGMPYAVPFDDAHYVMTDHADRAHFRVEGLGSTRLLDSAWLATEPYDTLSLSTLSKTPTATSSWGRLRDAALATGAFPIGLAPRALEFAYDHYLHRAWPRHAGGPIAPYFNGTPPTSWAFASVDGGALNNEPFEIARWTLLRGAMPTEQGKKADLLPNERAADAADRAVIMIDPFPNGGAAGKTPLDAKRLRLHEIIPPLLDALLAQGRFKLDELLQAANPAIHSRFLIAPARHDLNRLGERALACGALGGFAGFVDQAFREHDFALGRANCHSFLRGSFRLSANNDTVFQEGRNNEEVMRPLVPLCGSARAVPALPSWPDVSEAQLTKVEQELRARTKRFLTRFVGDLPAVGDKRLFRWPAQAAIQLGYGGRISDKLSQHLRDSLAEHQRDEPRAA